MIKAGNYGAFRYAAANGHLHVMERLLMELAPNEVQALIKAGNYEAFRWAAENGHLHVMERLMECAPNEVQAMIKASGYYAFRYAAENGHLPVMERLMDLAPNETQVMKLMTIMLFVMSQERVTLTSSTVYSCFLPCWPMLNNMNICAG